MILAMKSGVCLTEREQETLYLVACGLSNKEIAEELSISSQTVKTHLGNMITKTRRSNRAALVAFGFESGILTTEY